MYLLDRLPKGISCKKAEQFLYELSINMLLSLLCKLQKYLVAVDGYANIVCDTGRRNEVFKLLDSFYVVQQWKVFNRLSLPQFKTGVEEPLLQLADVLAYFLQRAFAPNIGDFYREEAILVCKKVFQEHDVGEHLHEQFFSPLYGLAALAMLAEIAFIHSGGAKSRVTELKTKASVFADELYNMKMKKTLSIVIQCPRLDNGSTNSYTNQLIG